MQFNTSTIDQQSQQKWQKYAIYKVNNTSDKPKYYVLDMFPYPSGAGLHVGHPLGYVASDIFARYKRLKGYNVLHPMGFDAFGLPAEQYAIQQGKAPQITTEENIANYKKQLAKIGLSYDWDREVNTSEPAYYKWTQWIFTQIYSSYFNPIIQKATPISELETLFTNDGNSSLKQYLGRMHSCTTVFSAMEWKNYSSIEKQTILLKYRLAYIDYASVNWCEALGTVLANDEVINGLSERGNHPVERKKMRQWFLRTTALADRLLDGLDTLDWTDALKEMQRNWIGKSEGASIHFPLDNSTATIEVFTTRPDTIYEATFLTIAPEHPLVAALIDSSTAIADYVYKAKNRSDRDRMAEVKKVTGVFSGLYAIHPFRNTKIPVWIGDYVLGGYGTGAVMAVPISDARDFAFATEFNLPIQEPETDTDEDIPALKEKAIQKIEAKGIGKRTINYRLRDAGFSRQRYWGEPFPITYNKEEINVVQELPVILPIVAGYQPTKDGKSPLAAITEWTHLPDGSIRETDTMPGFAGSSWYFLRYMDPTNTERFVGQGIEKYWQQVDVYLGGTEHAVGHLLYARFTHKILFDLGHVSVDEPFKKLVNQGMILGRSSFVYYDVATNSLVTHSLLSHYPEAIAIHIAIHWIKEINGKDILDKDLFIQNRKDYTTANWVLEADGSYVCGHEIEKMSKSKFNVVNPDDIVDKYGADTFRMYEMFLGPIEQSKPWLTNGIEGVYRFLRKLWRLFYDENDNYIVTEEIPTEKELAILHKTIKKVGEDIERFSFNTCVSSYMIAVNSFAEIKCHKKAILKDFLVLLSSFAPHTTEVLWESIGEKDCIITAEFPIYKNQYLQESNCEYPVSFNGKVRFKVILPTTMPALEVENFIRSHAQLETHTEGKSIKKIIVVPTKIINIVLG